VLSDALYNLRWLFKGLNVFHYITFRSVAGALTAFLLCYVFLPMWIDYFHRRGLGQVIRPDGPQSHKPKAGTPTMGGLVVILVASVCLLLWAKPGNPLVWMSLLALLWFGGIGAVDDWLKLKEMHSRGLSPNEKLLWQFVGAIVISVLYLVSSPGGMESAGTLSLPFLKHPVPIPLVFYIFLSSVVMVGTSNAVNLTDGLDGLAAGLIALAAVGLAVVAYLAGNLKFSAYLRIPYVPNAGELAVVCAIVVGACLGFLWYNAPPAQVFMGDVGALGLGGILGAMAVFAKAELLLVIFGGVFVLEALSVLAQVGIFKLSKRRVFLMAPLHHHFELKGLPESKLIIRFWIFSLLLVISMLMTLKLR
jgi:phospho-N-acetylmuramoyl-pentapeptide-transferase